METEDRQPKRSEEPTEAQPEQHTEAQPEEPSAPGRGEAAGQPPPGPRRMFRSRQDRVLGGVAGGLGRYFDLDPVIFRIGLVVLAFLGGSGLLVYAAALLLIPNEPEGGAPAAPVEGRGRTLGLVGLVVLLLVGWPLLLGGGLLVAGLLVPLALLVGFGVLTWWLVSGEGPSGDAGDIARRTALGIGVLIVICILAVAAAWAAGAGGGTVVAILVIGAGVAILTGAFLRPVRWLILPALAIALAAGTVSAAGIDLSGGVGDREYRPSAAGNIPDSYELGMGELLVDLRNTDLPPGDTPLDVRLGLGQITVLVPEDVCVSTRAEVGAGEVAVFDRGSQGVDVDWEDEPSAPSGGSRIVLDADIGLGALNVSHDRLDRAGFDRFGEGFGDRFGDEENTGCSQRAVR
jgi:phage shock protein PspC (stress-responsive transcriptional regulator)